jgi:TolB-like protein
MASVWGELNRRNVVRVAIAYAVVSWLLIQVADVVLDNIDAPTWLFQAILLLLVIGFPVAIIFAWAFELTPEGLKKEKDVDRSESITHVTGRKLDFAIIGFLVVALALFAIERFVLLPGRTPAIEFSQEIVATEIQQSIAVLPFVNMSSDPEQEYFSDGLSEEILNLLARSPELKVIGRTSSFAFKGKNEDLRVIGEALGVNTLLEGSVRKAGNEIRITAQLIDTSDASHIWSETYDRTLDDIFAVQEDVATAIINALQIHVGANPTRGRPTDNTEAYALFLKARASLNGFEIRNAEVMLLEAVELDPTFAEAYELLAYCYFYQCRPGVNAVEGQELTGDAAAQALAIDPDLVLAQALYEAGNIESWSYLGELEAFERAVRQQPGNPALLNTWVFDLTESGYLREALGVAERYVELDPLSSTANLYLANALFAVGRTSESHAARDLALQLGNDVGNLVIGEVNLLERQDDIAIAHFEAYLEQNGLASNWVSTLVTGARDPATGQAHLDRRVPQIVASMPEEYRYDWQTNLTKWYLLFGFIDRHFELILDLNLTNSRWTDADELLWSGSIYRRTGFTAYPKYLDVAKSVGLIDVWEQRGPPDFCEKVDGDWVCK